MTAIDLASSCRPLAAFIRDFIMLGSRDLAMKRASWVDSFAGARVLSRYRVGWPEVGYHAAGHGLVSSEEALYGAASPE